MLDQPPARYSDLLSRTVVGGQSPDLSGLALAGLLTPVFAWRKNVLFLIFSAITLYVLATGTLTPLWDKIPLSSALEPRRFLFPAYLMVALAIAAMGGGRWSVDHYWRKRNN